MKPILLALALSYFGTTPAQAFDHPVLDEYQSLSDTLIAQVEAAQTEKEIALLHTDIQKLSDLGIQIANLYSEKNPNCKPQLDQMLSELPTMRTLTATEVFDRYHDAVGIAAAPFHCIYGRVYLVHPVMNEIRTSTRFDEATRAQIIADFKESVFYLPKLDLNLNNPPN